MCYKNYDEWVEYIGNKYCSILLKKSGGDNILENQKLSNADVRAINCKICHDINNEITACMKLPGVKDYDDYEVINRGATSLCYLSKNDAQQKTILKVFEPESFPLTLITPYSDIEHDTVVSYNWIDCNKADAEQEYAFLKRFVRFILQEELITTLTEHHISHNSASIKVGTILESKKTPGVYGLRNDSGRIWEVTYPGQSATTYAIGKTVTLMLGTEIKIGNVNVIVKNRLATI